jgi:hypothetical protein
VEPARSGVRGPIAVVRTWTRAGRARNGRLASWVESRPVGSAIQLADSLLTVGGKRLANRNGVQLGNRVPAGVTTTTPCYAGASRSWNVSTSCDWSASR